jgi:hypothetical protein
VSRTNKEIAADTTLPGLQALMKCGAHVLACETEGAAAFFASLTPEEQNALQVFLDVMHKMPASLGEQVHQQAQISDSIGPLVMDPLVTNEELGRQIRLLVARLQEEHP